MMLPLLGFFDTNYFEYGQIADHWQYHALPGLLVALVALLTRATERICSRNPQRLRVCYCGGATLLLTSMTSLASLHFVHFGTEIGLWTYVISRNPNAWVAWNNLGAISGAGGRWDLAIKFYQRAVSIENKHQLRLDLAKAYALSGNWPEAEQRYRLEEEINGSDVSLRNSHAAALMHLNRPADAVAEFQKTLEIQPGNTFANTGLLTIFVRQQRWKEAENVVETAVVDDASCNQIAQIVLAAVHNDPASRSDAIHLLVHASEHRNTPSQAIDAALRAVRSGSEQ